jgi:hypothetical protein
MKINWKTMAASLALSVGISGAAFGQDRDDNHDGDNRARVVDHYRDHDRDDRAWINQRIDRDDRRVENRWYGDHDCRDRENFRYKNNYRKGYGR